MVAAPETDLRRVQVTQFAEAIADVVTETDLVNDGQFLEHFMARVPERLVRAMVCAAPPQQPNLYADIYDREFRRPIERSMERTRAAAFEVPAWPMLVPGPCAARLKMSSFALVVPMAWRRWTTQEGITRCMSFLASAIEPNGDDDFAMSFAAAMLSEAAGHDETDFDFVHGLTVDEWDALLDTFWNGLGGDMGRTCNMIKEHMRSNSNMKRWRRRN